MDMKVFFHKRNAHCSALFGSGLGIRCSIVVQERIHVASVHCSSFVSTQICKNALLLTVWVCTGSSDCHRGGHPVVGHSLVSFDLRKSVQESDNEIK
jgi:hypothetical protein